MLRIRVIACINELCEGSASGTSSYQVQVLAIDAVQNQRNTNSNATVTALTSEHVIYCMDGGLNVSFGKEGTRQNALEISGNWKVYHGDYDWTSLVEGITDIAHGGTGAGTAAGALSNLGAAASNHKHGAGDITSGTLPIARGGTGASDAATARSNLGITPANIGAATSSHNHSAGNITSGTLAAARLPYKFAFGTASLTGISWTTVSLSSAGFTSTPVIVCTPCGAPKAINGNYDLSFKTQNESASSFEVCFCGSSGSGTRTINWLAIGT